MTKKAYRKLVTGHLQWSLIGLIIAFFVAFITSDHRGVVYGVPATEFIALPISTAPAAAPPKQLEPVIPDTIHGKLVWPDPWDQITDFPLRNY